MSLKIRLARGGAKKRPFYSIVVADARSPRDGRFIEKLGTYNPMLERGHADRVTLKEERIKHWLGVGAQPSDRVARFLGEAGVGVVAGAHGVRGAVRIKSFTANPEDVAGYGPLEDESGRQRFSLRLVGATKGVLIGWLSGVADRDRAEALRGLRLYLPRAALPPTEDEEFYHA